MNFLADESVDGPMVDCLREDGHDLLSITEMEPSLPDETVLAMANQRDALLLTADKDFGELVFRQRHVAAGVVLIRLAGLSPATKAMVVSATIREHVSELRHAFTVKVPAWSGFAQRLESPPLRLTKHSRSWQQRQCDRPYR